MAEKKVNSRIESNKPASGKKKKKKSTARIIGRIFLIFGMLLSAVAGAMAANVVHKSDMVLDMINYDESKDLDQVDLSKYKLDSDVDIVNILLVGADKNPDEQDVEGAERRSDSMMIGTLDMKHKRLKLTSLMRDMYVEVPGHGSQKLNAAYSLGGIDLLYETIAMNFGVKMDGYAEVNFDAFVNVIDQIGGVNLEITKSEAKHLNTTNYIKRRKYRNLKVGRQTLNGYQALGYCRIRHGKMLPDGTYPGVYTKDGKGDDYARVERQRMTMQAILDKVKTLSATEILDLAKNIMPSITTDLKKNDIYSYMLAVVQMGTTKINQFSVPIDGSFSNQNMNGQQVLVADITRNEAALKKFIYK